MSAKHADPEYRKNARIIRARVNAAHKVDRDVTCWRCRGRIAPDQAYDVGHIDPAGGHGLTNLAPEHRYKVGRCRGNRAAGGQLGALKTNTRRATTKGLLPW